MNDTKLSTRSMHHPTCFQRHHRLYLQCCIVVRLTKKDEACMSVVAGKQGVCRAFLPVLQFSIRAVCSKRS